VEPKIVGEILEARKKRLIRSDVDALDAIVEAIQAYSRGLRRDRLGDLDDFWNLPTRSLPSPKDEQRASEKIGGAIREYLREYAVTADREVQVVRRLTPADAGGAPGSKPDVLCRIPAGATATDTPIAIPLEVKLSFNPQARSGLQDQLLGRYIPQVAATGGVFVLVWMDAARLSPSHRPLWKTLAAAQQDLNALAADANANTQGSTDVRVTFVDASLPTVPTTRSRRPRKAKKPRAVKRRTPRRRTSTASRASSGKRKTKRAGLAHGPKSPSGQQKAKPRRPNRPRRRR
jgi:hypothetical protein